MFHLIWTEEARTRFDELEQKARASIRIRRAGGKKKSTKDEGLFKQVQKAIAHLIQNPRHPGLRTHEYDSITNPFDKKGKVFEAYAQNDTPGAYRVFWCYGPRQRQITIISITPHP